jgi:hypothetical protein
MGRRRRFLLRRRSHGTKRNRNRYRDRH